MPLRFCIQTATALTLSLAPMAAMADGVWEGSWDTNYPNLNLIQDGQLVYGEYEDRGWIVGLTDASGSILRGAWVYTSGRWGALEFRMQPGGTAFVGEWDEEVTSFPYGSGTAWTGTRLSSVPSFSPEFAGDIEWPDQFDFNDPATRPWLENGQGGRATPVIPILPVAPVSPEPTATPLQTGAVQCPEVAMDPGLTASNNPHVTQDGISDVTSAPWTIYAQPAAAPLGSMSFTSSAVSLRFDACIPLYGSDFASTRRTILIHRAEMLRNGSGDWEGIGLFNDPALGVRGDVRLYLTDPAQGEGLAALTITGVDSGGSWAESVLLDYSAD